MKQKIDLLINNGLLFDGTGSEPSEADIGISGDKIAFLKKKSGVRSHNIGIKAEKIIDARNLVVTPGFIDTHAHSEFTLLADSRAEGKVCQGITTEINGNCGLSAAPLYGEAIKQREEDLKELGIRERWSTFGEYFVILERKGIAINFATLTGHGNIRASVIGYKNKMPNNDELKEMQALLRRSITDGAIGMSTGLPYPPGVYADTKELIELCKVLSQYHNPPSPPFSKGGKGGFGIYASHMRSEGDRLLESIEEIVRIGKETGIAVHISHIKTSGKKNWHKIDNAISLMEEAQKQGVRITCDRYPYTAASTDLDTVLPSWMYEGGMEKEIERLRDLEIQKKIKREILSEHKNPEFWEHIHIATVSSEKNKWMEGKTIAYIASRQDSDPIDIFLKILIEERLRIGAIFSSMNEDNLKSFLSLPYVMIGSDSSARSTDGPTHKGKPHPRGFGTFPRFLGRYVRDNGLIGMNKAIHKITMLPAMTFGINKRGIIKKGAFADIVIFDHKRMIDRATFDEPFLKPEGIYYVIVNGKPVIWEGEITGIKHGKILRHGTG
ncbi:MAG: D-aminoacylase [Nitrospirota bacterium]